MFKFKKIKTYGVEEYWKNKVKRKPRHYAFSSAVENKIEKKTTINQKINPKTKLNTENIKIYQNKQINKNRFAVSGLKKGALDWCNSLLSDYRYELMRYKHGNELRAIVSNAINDVVSNAGKLTANQISNSCFNISKLIDYAVTYNSDIKRNGDKVILYPKKNTGFIYVFEKERDGVYSFTAKEKVPENTNILNKSKVVYDITIKWPRHDGIADSNFKLCQKKINNQTYDIVIHGSMGLAHTSPRFAIASFHNRYLDILFSLMPATKTIKYGKYIVEGWLTKFKIETGENGTYVILPNGTRYKICDKKINLPIYYHMKKIPGGAYISIKTK